MTTKRQKGNYYLARKTELLGSFEGFSMALRQVLTSRYGATDAQEIHKEIGQEYETLIPQIPYIGGRKNRMTDSLVGTVSSLAVFKVLKARDETTKHIGMLHQQLVETHLSFLPRWRFRLMRAILSTKPGLALIKRSLKQAARASQRREYPEDFVFHFVEGKGQDFDLGLDYEECAVVKFFDAKGAEEFTAYVCLFDYVQSRLAGTGLIRTMTLAEGAEQCDFRFRIRQEPQNRQVTTIDGFL